VTANPAHPGLPGEDNVRMLHPFADAWTADKLVTAQFPEPRWAIPGIVPEGLSVLAGAPKVGKSWLAMNAAIAVAAGGRALASIPCEPGPVLYLALEDNPRRLQRRIRQVLDGQPAPGGLHLPIHCPTLTAGGAEQITGWLDYHRNARMVVIDVFAKIRGQIAGSNAYADDYRATGIAKTIADQYGIAVLLVHHIRKMGSEDFLEQLSGTNGIAGAADTIHVLQRSRGDADGVLHTTGRDVEETERAMRLDERTGTWHLIDGPALDHMIHETRAVILRYVRGHPGAGPKEISDATGLDIGHTRKTCARMATAGHLIRVGDGSYTAPPETAAHR
jgi:hypothetical protein